MQRFCIDIAGVMKFLSPLSGSFEARIQWGRSPMERLQTMRTRRTVSCWGARRRERRKTASDSKYPPQCPSNTMGNMEDMKGWCAILILIDNDKWDTSDCFLFSLWGRLASWRAISWRREAGRSTPCSARPPGLRTTTTWRLWSSATPGRSGTAWRPTRGRPASAVRRASVTTNRWGGCVRDEGKPPWLNW